MIKVRRQRQFTEEDWSWVNDFLKNPPDWMVRFLVEHGLEGRLSLYEPNGIQRRMEKEGRWQKGREWRTDAAYFFKKHADFRKEVDRGHIRADALSWTLVDQKFPEGGEELEGKKYGDGGEARLKKRTACCSGLSPIALEVVDYYQLAKFDNAEVLAEETLPRDMAWVYHHPLLRGRKPNRKHKYPGPPSSGAIALLVHAIEKRREFMNKVVELRMKFYKGESGSELGVGGNEFSSSGRKKGKGKGGDGGSGSGVGGDGSGSGKTAGELAAEMRDLVGDKKEEKENDDE